MEKCNARGVRPTASVKSRFLRLGVSPKCGGGGLGVPAHVVDARVRAVPDAQVQG